MDKYFSLLNLNSMKEKQQSEKAFFYYFDGHSP